MAMLAVVFLALVACDDLEPGIYASDNVFLPLVPGDLIDARGLLLDFPGARIPIQRLIRFVSAFSVTGNATFALLDVFGQVIDPKDAKNFIYNFTSFGAGLGLSVEEHPTCMHLLELDSDLEAGEYVINVWGKLSNEKRLNQSVLLFNGTATFYELSKIGETIGSVVLYGFFVAVLGGILFLIFSKDQVRTTSQPSKKDRVPDYAELHKAPVRTASPPVTKKERARSTSPK
jgi:hypothetical protein